MDEPLTSIFLAVIALTAILQAAFVGGLAFALRQGGRKLDELQDAVDGKVLPLLGRTAEMAATVEEATARVHEQAYRTERVLGDTADRIEAMMAGTREKLLDLGGRMDRAAAAMDDDRRDELAPLHDRVGQVTALARGVRRALQVWRGNGRPD